MKIMRSLAAGLFLAAGLSTAVAASAATLPAQAAVSCPALVAHRGDAYPYSPQPEVSMGAVALAYEDGAPAVAIPVHFSGKSSQYPVGDAVAIHDPTVNRTTAHTGSVDAIPVATLVTYKLLEVPDTDSTVTTQTIPTLYDMLAQAKAYQGRLLIQFKDEPISAAQAAFVAKELVEIGAWSANGSQPAGWVTVQSFFPDDLALMKAAVAATGHVLNMNLVGYSAATVASVKAAGDTMDDIDTVSYVGAVPLSAANVTALHTAGLLAGAWTPDTAAGWYAAAALGVDQITTDDPAGYEAWCAAGMPAS
jgi:glycerophosphoryl diester phosphodiesterase